MDAFTKPLPVTLLAKLASIVVHCDEATSEGAHGFDVIALRRLVLDDDVVEFIAATGVLAPVKRR